MTVLGQEKFGGRERRFTWDNQHQGSARDLLEKLLLYLPRDTEILIHFDTGAAVHFKVEKADTYTIHAWTDQASNKRRPHELFKELGIKPHTRWTYMAVQQSKVRRSKAQNKRRQFTLPKVADAALITKWSQLAPAKLPKQPRIHKSLDQARYRDSVTSPSVHESVAMTVDADVQMRIELEKIHENGMLSPSDKRLLGRLLSGAETRNENIAKLADILRKYPAVLKRLALRREALETTKQ